jgi:hypothetical protein
MQFIRPKRDKTIGILPRSERAMSYEFARATIKPILLKTSFGNFAGDACEPSGRIANYIATLALEKCFDQTAQLNRHDHHTIFC